MKQLEDYHIAQNKDIAGLQEQIDGFGSIKSDLKVGMIQLEQGQNEQQSEIKKLRSKFEGDITAMRQFDSAFEEKVNAIDQLQAQLKGEQMQISSMQANQGNNVARISKLESELGGISITNMQQ